MEDSPPLTLTSALHQSGVDLARSVGAALGNSTTCGALPGSPLPSITDPPHRRKARKSE